MINLYGFIATSVKPVSKLQIPTELYKVNYAYYSPFIRVELREEGGKYFYRFYYVEHKNELPDIYSYEGVSFEYYWDGPKFPRLEEAGRWFQANTFGWSFANWI